MTVSTQDRLWHDVPGDSTRYPSPTIPQMADEREIARRFMETYASGDADGLLACLTPDWRLHEEDGSVTTPEDIAEVTRSHAESFPEKNLEYLHEVVDGREVAQHVSFTLVHTGRYRGLEPTGSRIVLHEMIFHRFDGELIAESWRMTFPDSVYGALGGGATS